MDLTELIKTSIASGKAILGFRESLKYIKLNKPRLVIVANNIPEKMKEDIIKTKCKVEVFDGSSKELGTICGKPYPVSTVVIKG